MADGFICDSPEVHYFIDAVRSCLEANSYLEEQLSAMRPFLSKLLDKPDWLPAAFRQPVNEGAGEGLTNQLLYRDVSSGLTLIAQILAPGKASQIRSYCGWGLMGVYQGTQEVEVYEAAQQSFEAPKAYLHLASKNHREPGSFALFIPPGSKIQRVVCSSETPCISIVLLGSGPGTPAIQTYTEERSGKPRTSRSHQRYACRQAELKLLEPVFSPAW